MTVYLHMPSTDRAGTQPTLLGLDALRVLRDELAAYSGVRIVSAPGVADLDVEIVNVVADAASRPAPQRRRGQHILVLRMSRNGERLDFVCSDGLGELTAERQAARRIRNWVAGESLMSVLAHTQSTSGVGHAHA